MLEAWCTGLPVIATAVGGIPEVLSPELGVLLSSGDAQGLYEVIQKISKQAISFNRLLIHELAVGQYASSAVGQQLVRILESINAPHP
jgi:glycosyltransferase involved in cell wall biosynthesis